jgi:hypothetical protein
MGKPVRAAAFLLVLTTAISACGSLGDTKDKANTVDQAVNLLHEIDENGTWKQIADGIDNLAEQKQGFAAAVLVRQGRIDSTGSSGGPSDQEVTLAIEVDARNNALIHVSEVGQTRDYLVEGYLDASGSSRMYQIENGQYSCVRAGDDSGWLRNGVASVFENYAVNSAGVQILSVIDEAGDETVVNRTAIHYRLESRVPDALAILKKVNNTELEQRVNAAGSFQLAGDLYLDKDTQALLRFVSRYDDLDSGRRTEFTFEITRWGDVPDIPAPVENQIAAACQ